MKFLYILLIILWYYDIPLSKSTDSAWKVSIKTNTTCALNTLSQNYSGSSAGSFVWIACANTVVSRTFGQTAIHENTLKVGFGQTRIQDKNTGSWSSPVKSTDYLNLISVLKFNTQCFKDSYLSLKINSNFLDDRQKENKRYINPIETIESFGIQRKLFNKKEFSWKIDFGGALRQVTDRRIKDFDTLGLNYTYRNNLDYDGGLEFGSEITTNKNNWLLFTSKLYAYQALFCPLKEFTKLSTWYYPDIKWDNSVKVCLTPFLAFSYTMQFTLNKDLDSAPFIKQHFGISLLLDYSH